ncbi:MAG: hypothetical protein V4651_13300 [Bacteroidota bacterium]
MQIGCCATHLRTHRNELLKKSVLKKGFYGRFEIYIPSLMEKLGLAEVTHDSKGNKKRAK